jgi:hypothetical protein
MGKHLSGNLMVIRRPAHEIEARLMRMMNCQMRLQRCCLYNLSQVIDLEQFIHSREGDSGR